MKSFFGTIFAAVAAFHAAFGITGADVSVADFPRLAGESGDAARIMRAVEKAGGGGVVWFPRGEYEIDSMIVVSNRSSKFSAADRAGLSAKLRKAVRSNAAAADNLAGNGN